jgi:hypothetical protein
MHDQPGLVIGQNWSQLAQPRRTGPFRQRTRHREPRLAVITDPEEQAVGLGLDIDRGDPPDQGIVLPDRDPALVYDQQSGR